PLDDAVDRRAIGRRKVGDELIEVRIGDAMPESRGGDHDVLRCLGIMSGNELHRLLAAAPATEPVASSSEKRTTYSPAAASLDTFALTFTVASDRNAP